MSGSSRRTGSRSRRWLVLAAVVLPSLVLWWWIAGARPEVDPDRTSSAHTVDASGVDPAPANSERPDELEPTPNAVADARSEAVREAEPVVPAATPPPVFGSIVGTLRAQDSNAEAVSGKRISCVLVRVGAQVPAPPDPKRRYDPNRSAVTNTRGEFTIADLMPGEWNLGCDVNSYLPARLRCVVEAGGAATRVELTLVPRHQIAIYLTDDSGQPIVDLSNKPGHEALDQLAPLVCTKEPADRSSPCAGGGTIPARSRVPDPRDPRVWRVLELDTYDPMWIGLAIGDCVLDGKPVTGPERELHFRLRDADLKTILGVLRVQVSDTGGIGIPGAKIVFGTGQPPVRSAITDANGRVEMIGLPPVRTPVQCSHPSYLSAWKIADLECGAEVSVTVTMQTPIVVRGRLVDASGNGVSGTVYAICQPSEKGRKHDVIFVSADDSGRFEFGALAPELQFLIDKRRLDKSGASTREIDADTPGAVVVDGRLGSSFGVTVVASPD